MLGSLNKLQVLTNGIEVKLQRNVLGNNEDDDDLEFENVHLNGSDMGKLPNL